MISIGGVVLDEDLVWTNEYAYSPVRSSVTETLGGNIVIQEFARSEAGRQIDLQSGSNNGWLSKDNVDALWNLAAVPGAIYPLVIESAGRTLNKSVRFRNEEEGGPLAFSPIQEKEGLYPGDFKFIGTIRLMVV